MTYQEKVKAIYNIMADKTLSFGCMVKLKWFKLLDTIINWPNPLWESYTEYKRIKEDDCEKIIWHPIHIGVVLHHIEQTSKDRKDYHYAEDNIMSNWKDKRQPLPLNPTEERYPVIDFITSLLDQWT